MERRKSKTKEISNGFHVSLPVIHTENPVLSPRVNTSYFPLSKSSSRLQNPSEDGLGIMFKSPRNIEQSCSLEYKELENKLELMIEKSKGAEFFKGLIKNFKSLIVFFANTLSSSELLQCLRYMENAATSAEDAIIQFIKQKSYITKLLDELNTEKLKNKELQALDNQLKKQMQTLNNKLNGNDKNKVEAMNIIEISNRKHTLEKEKLIEKVSMLEEYITELKNVTKIEMISTKLEEYKLLYEKTSREYRQYSKEKEGSILKLIQNCGILKEQITSNESIMKNIHSNKIFYEDSLKEIESSKLIIQQKLYESNERLLMFKEDIVRLFKYKELYESAQDQISTWRNKYQQVELNIMAGNISLNSDGVTWVSLDDPIFAIARGTKNLYIAPNILINEKSLINKVDYASKSQAGKNKLSLDQNLDVTQISLKDYQLPRPLFAGFLDLNDSTLPLELPYSNWLEVTIRGIYDSKFYEHQLCSFETGRNPSRLPEFAYAWLGNFIIDNITRQIKELEMWKKPSADKIRLDLLLALSQEKLKKNWEIQTFLEFMNEDMMIDELAFFLHCRNLLFKGPQLGITAGQYSSAHFMPMVRVAEIIDVIMEKVSSSEREDLKNLLRVKSKMKEGIYSLDSGLVLRLLLEYYIREKKSKYLAIRTLYNLAPKNGIGNHLAFGAFKDIFKNLNPDISECTVARLFRDCYAIGNGIITPDLIFIICNDQCLFFHSLRLKTDMQKKENELKQVYYSYNHNKTSLNLIREAIKNMGISDLLQSFQKLEQCILSNEASEGLITPKNSLKHLWGLIFQIQNIHQEVNCVSLAAFITPNISEMEFTAGPESCKGFIELLESLTLYRLSTRIAIRKIQRNWKRRSTKGDTIGQSVEAFKKLIKNS